MSHIIWIWLAAMAFSSYAYVAAAAAAGVQARYYGPFQPCTTSWETAFLLALPALLVGVLLETHRGWIRRKRRLDMAPGILVALPMCAFALAHMAGGWGACDMPVLPYVAALASVGAVLSAVIFGAYYDVHGTSGRGRFPDVTLLVSVMAAAAFAYNMLQVADGWWPENAEVALPLFATIAMVATALAVGVFGAEYGRNRGQSLVWASALSVALITMSVVVRIVLGADDWEVVDGDDAYLYAVQTVWTGVTVAGAMLGARAAATFPKRYLPLWLTLTSILAILAVPYSDIWNSWECITSTDRCADPPGQIELMFNLAGHGTLRPWVSVTVLLAIWHIFVTMAAAMLGAAVASRMRTECVG